MKQIIIIVGCFLSLQNNFAQTTAQVFGVVTEIGTHQPLDKVVVGIKENNQTIETNAAGEYGIAVPTGKKWTLIFFKTGYKTAQTVLEPLKVGAQRRIDVELAPSTSIQTVTIRDQKLKNSGMIREDVKNFKMLPTTTANLESVLPHIALGTNAGTGGELSSQYQVRGGNYDENLVYVNDFEIYRPQLIRAGQQEGLTFANPDLMRDLSFSSGGFEARYGDKLSSVLDIKYKRADSTRWSIAGSFLGGSAHLEGSAKLDTGGYRKFRYLIGARYKTTRYLLGSLDTKGEYVPNFGDIQAYLTYDLNRDWQIGVLGNFNSSIYGFVPVSRSTAAGLINYAYQATTAFRGQERDGFTNGMGGISLTYLPDRRKNPYFLKFLAAHFQSAETEGIDIIGDYRLDQIEINLGSDRSGQVVAKLGEGTQHQYVRNYLYSQVSNIEHKGGYELQVREGKTHFFQWSVKFQHEDISDKINEWERLDSALYSLPFKDSVLLLKSVLKTQNSLVSNRINGYFQDTYTLRKDSIGELQITGGVRATYWNLNKEFVVSPRLQLAYKPLNWNKDISFRLAGGMYAQPAFYRELRGPDGIVNPNVLAQKSTHVVGGLTYDFFMGAKRRIPFRLISEIYYKKMWDLVSYDVDNVRVRYSGKNDATGYVMGWDTRINGEFVPGAESWINISFLRAREHLNDIQHLSRLAGDSIPTKLDDVPRPTDRFLTLSIFFQDYLPKNKNFKMNLNTTVGTGLPFGFPGNNIVYRNNFRFQPYHRVDIGFSYLMWDRNWLERKPHHPLRFTRNTWASLEIFNLMEVSNEASKTWLKSIYGQQYAVPNYLTSRRVNFRLRMDF
ncbi:MAG: hypothetical protein RLZZ628_1916 [Bacteroidota bacterium]|jgi:hypothetical protein